MIRVLFTQFILFLLPFLIYVGYLFLTDRLNRQAWIDAPRYWLVLAGLLVSIVGLIVMFNVNNKPLGGTYVPAHIENGELVPGHIVNGRTGPQDE